jgi:phosphoribosylformylglycinamidine (FGAM) synthase PurS component
MTKRLLVNFDDETYDALRRLAFENNTQMAKLVRFALDKTFEDELDSIIGEMRLKEHLQDPSGSVTIEELMEEMGIELPRRVAPRSKERARRAAG